jgi:hypothetical protein
MTTLKAMKKVEDARKEKHVRTEKRVETENHVGTDLPVRPTRAQLAVSSATVEANPAPAEAPDTPSPKKLPQSAPLSAHQLKLMKKIIRRGPSHPQFKLAARLLDHHIADRETA